MTTSWTPQEYGRVAKALLYPTSIQVVVIQGYSDSAYPIAYQLYGRLLTLDELGKVEALSLADQIQAAEAAYQAAVTNPDVTRVGEINLNPREGLDVREKAIARLRGRLALAVDFEVNPRASALLPGGGGGINGTCSG